MAQVRVVVSGSGYMGREVLAAVHRQAALEPVGVIEKFAEGDTYALPGSDLVLPMSNDPEALVAATKPDVIVDFTNADWTPLVAKAALAHGARLVVGTT